MVGGGWYMALQLKWFRLASKCHTWKCWMCVCVCVTLPCSDFVLSIMWHGSRAAFILNSFFTTMHNYCVRIWCQISDFQWAIRAVRVHLLPAASDQQPLSHHVCRALKLSIPSVRQRVMKTWLLLLISQLCEVRFKVSHKNKILRWKGCRKRLSIEISPFVPSNDTFITVLWNE